MYKVEPYLRQCIDSILAQTFTDFELILVDDGSPDNCGAICDEYAAKDDRIVVIHQENGGLSAARNAGLDWVFANSDSQWITFVDSDDCVVSIYLEQLYGCVMKTGVDIAMLDTKYFSENPELKNKIVDSVEYEVMDGRKACEVAYTEKYFNLPSAWGKLYRRKLYKDIRFTMGKVYEDQDLIPRVLFSSNGVAVIPVYGYMYRVRSGSIIHSKFSLKNFDYVDALDTCVNFYMVHGEKQLQKIAENRKRAIWAETVHGAWENNMYQIIPEKYKLPMWKVYWYVFVDSVRRGGIKFILRRIGNLVKKISIKFANRQ